MATLTIPDHTLARLQAAAAARKVSIEKYLEEYVVAVLPKQSSASRAAAADAIRELATEITNKISIDELVNQKHAGHKH